MESSLEQPYVVRKVWKQCNWNIPDASRGLEEWLHFKFTVREMAQGIREGQNEIVDKPRSGRPKTARTDQKMEQERDFCVPTIDWTSSKLLTPYTCPNLHYMVQWLRIHAVKLHHDNAASHSAFIFTNILTLNSPPVVFQPPYSPDLATCHFFLFPRLKKEQKEKHRETVENIQNHVTTFLKDNHVEKF